MFKLQSSYLQGFNIDEFVVVWWTERTGSGAEDSMETNEAAAALLNMESPNNILDEKRMSKFILCSTIFKMVANISSLIQHCSYFDPFFMVYSCCVCVPVPLYV